MRLPPPTNSPTTNDNRHDCRRSTDRTPRRRGDAAAGELGRYRERRRGKERLRLSQARNDLPRTLPRRRWTDGAEAAGVRDDAWLGSPTRLPLLPLPLLPLHPRQPRHHDLPQRLLRPPPSPGLPPPESSAWPLADGTNRTQDERGPTPPGPTTNEPTQRRHASLAGQAAAAPLAACRTRLKDRREDWCRGCRGKRRCEVRTGGSADPDPAHRRSARPRFRRAIVREAGWSTGGGACPGTGSGAT